MKKFFQLILGIGVLLLFTASVSFTQGPYFVSISGTNFFGWQDGHDYIHPDGGYVYKPVTAGWLIAHIEFPDDLKYIERMSFTYMDFMASGYIYIDLKKKNRWDGTITTIAKRNTGITEASNSLKTTSVILGPGRGIDNANFSYYARVFFSDSGSNLQLHSVTFKCQPY